MATSPAADSSPTAPEADQPRAVRELDHAPNLGALYPKAALTGFAKHGDRLPDLEIRRPEVVVDLAELAAYNRVCGFTLRDELPATYPHVLAFPLQAMLMTDPAFPFPLPGLVHIANRITQHRPVRTGEALELRVHAADLREHDKGRQFDVISEALIDDSPVWTDVSTYLRPGKSGSSSGKSGAGKENRAAPPEPTGVWRLPADLGRRYAAVSGDVNPIHLHALTAKAFGFPRAIAHGMWTKARCLAAFDSRLPEAYTVDVQFKLPILLPGTVGFFAQQVEQGWDFAVHGRSSGKPHAAGTIRAATGSKAER